MKKSAIIKAFGMTNMLLESDLDRIEREFGLDLGRGRIVNEDEWNEYLDSFDVSLNVEASVMAQRYQVFYCLERSIRGLVGDVLEAAEGNDGWWKKRIPSHINGEVKNRIRAERESGITPRSVSRLDYTTFGELSVIIKANWADFGSVLNDPKAVETVMSRLNTIRAPIAHCCPLGEDEVLRLQLSLRDWFRLLL